MQRRINWADLTDYQRRGMAYLTAAELQKPTAPTRLSVRLAAYWRRNTTASVILNAKMAHFLSGDAPPEHFVVLPTSH